MYFYTVSDNTGLVKFYVDSDDPVFNSSTLQGFPLLRYVIIMFT